MRIIAGVHKYVEMVKGAPTIGIIHLSSTKYQLHIIRSQFQVLFYL